MVILLTRVDLWNVHTYYSDICSPQDTEVSRVRSRYAVRRGRHGITLGSILPIVEITPQLYLIVLFRIESNIMYLLYGIITEQQVVLFTLFPRTVQPPNSRTK